MSNKKIIHINDDIIENDVMFNLYSNKPKSKIKRIDIHKSELIEYDLKEENIFIENGKKLLK